MSNSATKKAGSASAKVSNIMVKEARRIYVFKKRGQKRQIIERVHSTYYLPITFHFNRIENIYLVWFDWFDTAWLDDGVCVSESQLSVVVWPKSEESPRTSGDGSVLVAAAQVHDGVTLDPELRRSIVRKFWPEEKSLNNHKK